MAVYKMVEVVGTSGKSITHAVNSAVERAAATLDDLEWFEVKEIRGRLKNGGVGEYQVKLDIGFRLHAPAKNGGQRASASEHEARASRTKRATAAVAARGAQAKPRVAKRGVRMGRSV